MIHLVSAGRKFGLLPGLQHGPVDEKTPEMAEPGPPENVQDHLLSTQGLWCWKVSISSQWTMTVNIKVDKVQLVTQPVAR